MKMDPCKMSGCASFSTPCLSIAEVEEKLEELDVYLTEVTLKLQLMKDRAEMEERTEALRQELSELRQQPPPLPPVRHDLFLIRAGVPSDAAASSTAPYDDGTAALPTDEREGASPDSPHDQDDPHGGPSRSERRAQGLKTRRDVTRSNERTVRVGTGGWRLRAKRPRRWSVLYRRPRRRRGDVVPLRKGLKGLLFRRRSERSRGSVGVDGHREASGLGLGRYPESGARPKDLPAASQTRDDAGTGPSGEELSPSPTSFDAAAWADFTEGSLVWAKLGNSKWWPGMLVDGGRGGMSGSGGRPWVFWFGDHRISEVSRDRVVEFSAGLASLLQPDYVNKTYQLGLVEALRECRRQLGLDPLTGSLYQVIAWGRSAVTGDLTFRAVSVPAFVLSHLETIRKSQQRDTGTGRGDGETKSRPTEYPVPPRPDDVRESWRRPVRLESVCLSCGSPQVVRPHPLFSGGLCRSCEHAVRDTMFAHAEDNISPYCVVCCQPGQLLICDEASCSRGYCYVCLRLLIGPDAPERLTSLSVWRCPMCHERNDVTLLKRRSDWRQQVVELFVPQSRPTQPPPADQFSERRPIRVLSLFDGIATGMHVLSQLGVEVDVYLASETDADAIHVAAMNYPRVQQLGPVETLTDARVGELAPVDLVLGGSPCTDLSVVNPARRGLYDPDGTGILFFDFYRVLRSVEVSNKGRHVFWLFENVASMPVEYRKVISRFLQTEPALIDAKHFTAQSRPRFFWGNIPGLYSPLPPHLLRSEHSIADCLLLPSRRPVTEQVGCVTTSRNSLRQGKMAVTPVTMDGEGDVMWITEIEQMFGLPRHYTDVGNIGPQKRQQLLGRAWSAPVIKHILNSLTSFFATTEADRE